MGTLLSAVHDSMTTAVHRNRPVRVKEDVVLWMPWGTMSVAMFHCQSMEWTKAHPARFQEVMKVDGRALCAGARQCLKNVEVPSAYLKQVMRRLLGKSATRSRVRFVAQRLAVFLQDYAHSNKSSESSLSGPAQIQARIYSQGLPAAAVRIMADGPRVRLHVVYAHVRLRLPGDPGSPDAMQLQQALDKWAASQRLQEGSRTYIPTRHRAHGRDTAPGSVVDLDALGIARNGLLSQWLDMMPTPATHSELYRFVRQVRLLVGGHDSISKEMRRILGTPAAQLGQSDFLKLLSGLEARYAQRQLTERTRVEYQATFRQHLVRVLGNHGVRVQPPRRQRAPVARRSRRLISEEPDAHARDPANRPAIIHVIGAQPAEAMRLATAHVDDRLGRIDAACDEAIKEFVAWRAFMADAANHPLDERLRGYADKMVGVGSGPKALRAWFAGAPIEEIACVVWHVAKAHTLYNHASDHALRSKVWMGRMGQACTRLGERFPGLHDWCGGAHKGRPYFAGAVLLAWYVPRWVQLAIAMKVQLVTGWNRDTVRNLHARGIEICGSRVELQALKCKTEQMQHQIVEPADQCLRAGLKLMQAHDAQVEEHWPRESAGVFVTWVARPDGRRVFGCGIESKLLARFIKRYRLPKFSREQLRNQHAAGAFLHHGDAHRVQGELGHGNLRTTSGYLQSTVFRILNAANIARFQQVLSASVVWAVEGAAGVTEKGMALSDVSQRLLYPVGESASSDELVPPMCDVWMAQPDQPLIMDGLRLAHLIRQRDYYATHWQRLRAESLARFELVHLPRMEFTAALWALVSDSCYARLLEDAA